MIDPQSGGLSNDLGARVDRLDVFVDGVSPVISAASMRLGEGVLDSRSAVRPMTGDIAVAEPRHPWTPGCLDRRPPPGLDHLIEVEREANIDVVGQQIEGSVPGHVEAPGVDRDLVDDRAAAAQARHRVVCAPGVGDEHQIGLAGRRQKTPDVSRLVLCDGVDRDPHR
jgi:hypothetical protein